MSTKTPCNPAALEQLGRDIEATVKAYDEWQHLGKSKRHGYHDAIYIDIARRNFESALDKLRDVDLEEHL